MTANWLVPRRSSGSASRGSWPAAAIHGGLDRLLEDLWSGFDLAPSGALAEFTPRVDIEETEAEFRVTAELPGLEEKDFEVSLDGDVLSLKGEKKVEREAKRAGLRHVETTSGSFHRAFRLPVEVDGDAVKAVFDKGVLTVTLPKHERSRPREIPITTR